MYKEPGVRVGISTTNTRDMGGQFQFLVMVLDALFSVDITHDYFLFYFSDEDKLEKRYQKPNWHWVNINESQKPFSFGKKDTLKEKLSKYKIDFMIFPVWTNNCWECGVPFGFAVHDLQHCLQPEFPEVSTGGRLEWRKRFFSNAIANAEIIIVDSEEGKRNVLSYHNCDPEKIEILPYTIPSSSMARPDDATRKGLIRKMGIADRFLFYPAQLWPHKNHLRIVEALGILKNKHGLKIPIIFVGKPWPERDILKECESIIKDYSIENQIRHFGYVGDEELATLYSCAEALVMPTFFGPTNIPYLEAFYHGCMVIASDISGIREQVGEAALLVDPKDTGAIADAIYKLWTDKDLCNIMISKGEERVKEFLPDKFKRKLESIIDKL